MSRLVSSPLSTLASDSFSPPYPCSSKSLTRYMLEEKSKKWDKKVWKKEEVKVGVHLNNFCIVVK